MNIETITYLGNTLRIGRALENILVARDSAIDFSVAGKSKNLSFIKANRLSQPKACNFIEKETLALVLSCEFCRISKNTFFYETPLGDYF